MFKTFKRIIRCLLTALNFKALAELVNTRESGDEPEKITMERL